MIHNHPKSEGALLLRSGLVDRVQQFPHTIRDGRVSLRSGNPLCLTESLLKVSSNTFKMAHQSSEATEYGFRLSTGDKPRF